jgi:hypothetical protein
MATDTLTGKWVEIFKTGVHQDSRGNKREWHKFELEQMVNNFAHNSFSVPLTLGHNVTDSTPAYGWISDLKIVGNSLYCKVKHVANSFLELFNARQIPNRSLAIGINEKGCSIMHLAFLGAVPPAIELAPIISFSKSEEKQVFYYEVFMQDQPIENGSPPEPPPQELPKDEPPMEMEVEIEPPPPYDPMAAMIAELKQENIRLANEKKMAEDALAVSVLTSAVMDVMKSIRETSGVLPYAEDGGGLSAFVSSVVQQVKTIKYTSLSGEEKRVSGVEFFKGFIKSIVSSPPIDISTQKPLHTSFHSAFSAANPQINPQEKEIVERIVAGAKKVRPL